MIELTCKVLAVLKSSKIPIILLAAYDISKVFQKNDRGDDEAPGDNFPNILGNVEFGG